MARNLTRSVAEAGRLVSRPVTLAGRVARIAGSLAAEDLARFFRPAFPHYDVALDALGCPPCRDSNASVGR